jgi:hypothetical protein
LVGVGSIGVGAGTAGASPLLYASPNGTGDWSSPATPCSLTTALSDVPNGGTIELITAGTGAPSSYYSGGFTVPTSGPTPSGLVTIEAEPGLSAPPILDGDGTSTVLTNVGATVEVSGVTIQDGNNDGGTLTVTDSTFSNNTAVAGGGIDNGDFSDSVNPAPDFLTVTDSMFVHNHAVTDDGGAIDNGNGSGSGTATVTSSTFSDNSATYDGGAIDNAEDATGTLTVRSSTFSGDTAGTEGGAIDNAGYSNVGSIGMLTVTRSTFSDNSAIDGGAIDNADQGQPGTIGTLTVSSSTFSGNTATADGAAIDNGDANAGATLQLTLAASVFASSCTGVRGSAGLTDNGFNVGVDSSCFGTAPKDNATMTTGELGPLTNNSGPTQTIALSNGNPAIGIISNPTAGLCPVVADQRGMSSAPGIACDAGAIQFEPPLTPAAPTSSGVGDGTVTVNWTAPAANGAPVTGYNVQVATAPGGPYTNATGCTSVGTVLTCTASGLTDGTGYYFEVEAMSLAGNSPCSAAGGPFTPPAIPTPTPVSSQGYWEVATDGGIFSFGTTNFYGSMGGRPLNAPVVAMAASPDHGGYDEVAADGGVFSFGDARFFGSLAGRPVNQPIVGMAITPDGGGYWLVAADGGVFSFGDAGYFGSLGGQDLAAPIVAIVGSADGGGYWLGGDDGRLYTFGDASFSGAYNGPISARVMGVAITPDHLGYHLAGSDGSVYAVGDAVYDGSMAGRPLNIPIVALVTPQAGGGYWLVGGDGGIFSFGTAFLGSMGGRSLNAPVIGAAAA